MFIFAHKMAIYEDITGKKQRKKGVNSRVKGMRAELRAAEFLKKWTGVKFYRVPQSGGLHWKGVNNIFGDIVVPEGIDFPFSVEVKSYKKLVKHGKVVKGFWNQATVQAQASGKLPLLLMRENDMSKYDFYLTVGADIAAKVKAYLKEHDFEAYYKASKTGKIYHVPGYYDLPKPERFVCFSGLWFIDLIDYNTFLNIVKQ